VQRRLADAPAWLRYASAAGGASFVTLLGTWLARRRAAPTLVELSVNGADPGRNDRG